MMHKYLDAYINYCNYLFFIIYIQAVLFPQQIVTSLFIIHTICIKLGLKVTVNATKDDFISTLRRSG